MTKLKNDLFERKKKTIIELDAAWRKKMKTLTAQLEEEQARKCDSEKTKIVAQEKEDCVVKTTKLKQTIDLTEELKISLSEQCESEKNELRTK